MSRSIDHFSSRMAFILVTAGAAVGLGNVWAFPFMVGDNGGGTFFVLYLFLLLVVATPVMVAELLLGRMGQASPPNALKKLGSEAGSPVPWAPIAWIGVAATILILSYYSVIAGQAMAYGFKSITGTWAGLEASDVVAVNGAFKGTIREPALWHTLFMATTIVIVARDIRSGIERTAKYLMPLLFILLIALVLYSMTTSGFTAAVAFLFDFKAVEITAELVIKAFGLAFFTLSLGVGGIMMYGAYMGKDINLGKTVGWIVAMDLFVAVLAGLAIFPLVFTNDMDPAMGPGLVFQTLPIIFASITGGGILGTVFFLLLTVAAITSAVALMAPSVQWLAEKGWSRQRAAITIGAVIYILGYITVFSYNIWGSLHPLGFIPALDGMNLFDLIREGINVIVLPLGGLAFALMIGWGLDKAKVMAALPSADTAMFRFWYGSLRFIVPIAIIALFLSPFFGGE